MRCKSSAPPVPLNPGDGRDKPRTQADENPGYDHAEDYQIEAYGLSREIPPERLRGHDAENRGCNHGHGRQHERAEQRYPNGKRGDTRGRSEARNVPVPENRPLGDRELRAAFRSLLERKYA